MHCKIACLHYMYELCVLLIMKPVGCDNVLNSGARADVCGVCYGNGTGAKNITRTLTGSGGLGYHTAGVIPARARAIRIVKVTQTSPFYLGKA